MNKTFKDYGISDEITDSLKMAGIEYPFEIQELSLPHALQGKDIIGQAKTGTGKTFAFGIPLLEKISGGNSKPRALIILPTRELALQVRKELELASTLRKDNLNIALLYGGVKIEKQMDDIKDGSDIIVGTPGRIIDFLHRGLLDLSEVQYLVLDEADVMLNFGFIADIESIIKTLPTERQSLLFSATLPNKIVALAKKYMKNPTRISTMQGDEVGETVDRINNFVFRTHPMDKPELLARMLQSEPREKSIIFTKMKHRADKLKKELSSRGFDAYVIHGGVEQSKREKVLNAFKTAPLDKRSVLVASDVVARGIDIDNISHVYNYECPDDESSFLHRTGRTGRAGTIGSSITYVDWEDMMRWKMIAEKLGIEDIEPEETYSGQDAWHEKVPVPEGITGYVNGASAEDRPKNDSNNRRPSRNGDRQGGSRNSGGSGGNQRGRSNGGSRNGDRNRSNSSANGKPKSEGTGEKRSNGEHSNEGGRPPRKRNRVRKFVKSDNE